MSEPAVSIVLPVHNGAADLPALFDALERQRAPFTFETIAIDSGSTDGSPALLRARANQVVEIPPGSFDHGLTRNLGIERARGELVVLLVQDAVPASDAWLAALTAPLMADPTVAGSFARQVPRPGASALARWSLERYAASSGTARTAALTGRAEFDALSPRERLDRCAFDNVCCCIRRAVWEAHPFGATPMAEDLAWARDVLLAGHRIAYAPAAVVVHSHDRSVAYEFDRTRKLHRRLNELFGLRTIPATTALAPAIAATLAAHLRREWSARAIGLAVAWPLAQYLGARDADGTR